jgi:hypothetical protein
VVEGTSRHSLSVFTSKTLFSFFLPSFFLLIIYHWQVTRHYVASHRRVSQIVHNITPTSSDIVLLSSISVSSFFTHCTKILPRGSQEIDPNFYTNYPFTPTHIHDTSIPLLENKLKRLLLLSPRMMMMMVVIVVVCPPLESKTL